MSNTEEAHLGRLVPRRTDKSPHKDSTPGAERSLPAISLSPLRIAVKRPASGKPNGVCLAIGSSGASQRLGV